MARISGACAISALLVHAALGAVVNQTVYRITPRNYSDPINMNTGDEAGDAFFGLLKLGLTNNCKNSTMGPCTPSTRIPGFNVFIQFTIEMDDRVGPYSQCNPDAATGQYTCARWFGDGGCWFNSTTHPEWKHEFADVCDEKECECPSLLDKAVGVEYVNESSGSGSTPPPTWPKQCKAANYYPVNGTTWGGPGTTLIRSFQTDEGSCCAACSGAQPPHVSGKESCTVTSYWGHNKTCHLLNLVQSQDPTKAAWPMQDETVFSAYHQPVLTPAQKAFNDGNAYLRQALMPGRWFSTPDKGMCKEGEVVGRDCWWRLVSTDKIVNSSCVDAKLIDEVAKRNQTCFNECDDPHDQTSDCWVRCFYNTIMGNSTVPGVTHDEFQQDFLSAFKEPAAGGCPVVPPCPHPCLPPCWAVKKGEPCDPNPVSEVEYSDAIVV